MKKVAAPLVPKTLPAYPVHRVPRERTFACAKGFIERGLPRLNLCRVDLDVKLEGAVLAAQGKFVCAGLEGKDHVVGFRAYGLAVEDGAEGAATIAHDEVRSDSLDGAMVARDLVGVLVPEGEIVGGKDVGALAGLSPPDAEWKPVESDNFGGTGFPRLFGARSQGDFGEGVDGLVRSRSSTLFEQLVDFSGRDFAALQFASKKFVGIAESLKKGGKKRGEGTGIGKEKIVELRHVHHVDAGGFQGSGSGRAGFVIEQGHLAKNIAGQEVPEGNIALAGHMNGNFNATLQDPKGLIPFFPFAKDELPLAERLFAHTFKG